jgi:hypothetical protein
MTTRDLQRYQQRAERFLRDFRRIPHNRVNLDVWARTDQRLTGGKLYHYDRIVQCYVWDRMPPKALTMTCGAVACLGGWGSALYRKPYKALCQWLGLSQVPWRGHSGEHLFEVRVRHSVSSSREACDRLRSRIAQLKQVRQEQPGTRTR